MSMMEFLEGKMAGNFIPVAEETARRATKAITIAGSAAGQSYVRQFFDSGVWNESMFDEKESNALKNIVSNKVRGGKSGLSYSDYNATGGKNLSYKAGITDLSDPAESLKMTLGRATIVRDQDNNLMVVDEYDFDSPTGLNKLPLSEKVGALVEAARNDKISTYGLAHLFAEAFGSSGGDGASIRAKVGTAEEFGLREEDIGFLPTLEEYEKQNKGRIKQRQTVPSNKKTTPIVEEPTPTPAVEPVVVQPQKEAAKSIEIKSGDTLGALAKKHGTTVAALAAANNIEDVNKIYAGQSLVLPE